MKYKFTLDDYTKSSFELDSSVWTGKSFLYMDGKLLKQSTEKGRPFLIPTKQGELKGFPKSTFPDFSPSLIVDGKKHQMVEQLEWYKLVLGALPVLLIFLGGAIGGALGLVATIFNFQIFRSDNTTSTKYAKVIVINIAAYVVFLVFANLVLKQLNS